MAGLSPSGNGQRPDARNEDRTGLGGHPRGLTTLFFTEMWERFSYYGMRALLILYMTPTAVTAGLGLGMDNEDGGEHLRGLCVLVLFICYVYSGRLDRGQSVGNAASCVDWRHHHRAVAIFLWLRHQNTHSSPGLVLIVLGTGLLKPNVSTIVGELYSPARPAAR